MIRTKSSFSLELWTATHTGTLYSQPRILASRKLPFKYEGEDGLGLILALQGRGAEF